MKRFVIAEDNLIQEICRCALPEAEREKIDIFKAGDVGKVANSLMNVNIQNALAIGIIDKDPEKNFKTKHLLKFKNISRETEMPAFHSSVIIRRVPSQSTPAHTLILLENTSETWILDCAKQGSVSPQDYNLPDTPKELRKTTKSDQLHKNENVKQFLIAIRRANPLSFSTLQQWLRYELSRFSPQDLSA